MQLKFIWQTAVLLLSLSATAQAAPIYSSSAGIIGGKSHVFPGESKDGLGLFGAEDANLDGQSVGFQISFERNHTIRLEEPLDSRLRLTGPSGPFPSGTSFSLTLTVGNATNKYDMVGWFEHRIDAGATQNNRYVPIDALVQRFSGISSEGYRILVEHGMWSYSPFNNHALSDRAYLSHDSQGSGVGSAPFTVLIYGEKGPFDHPFTLLTGSTNAITFDGTAVDPAPIPEPATGALMLLALLGVHAARRKAQQR